MWNLGVKDAWFLKKIETIPATVGSSKQSPGFVDPVLEVVLPGPHGVGSDAGELHVNPFGHSWHLELPVVSV
jgi:hypothetical protein